MSTNNSYLLATKHDFAEFVHYKFCIRLFTVNDVYLVVIFIIDGAHLENIQIKMKNQIF